VGCCAGTHIGAFAAFVANKKLGNIRATAGGCLYKRWAKSRSRKHAVCIWTVRDSV